MKKTNFKNGILVSKAKVTINGTIYEVEPEEYEGETPLSAEVLNEMQDNIEESIDEINTNLNNKITNLSTYSTEEVKTGEYWVDGKPIYRKSFTFAVSSSSHKATINVADLNISTGMFDFSNSYLHDVTNNRYTPIIVTNVSTSSSNTTATSTNQAGVYFNSDFTALVVEGGASINLGAFITIRYTKTTD